MKRSAPRSTRRATTRTRPNNSKARSCRIPRPGQKCPHCHQGVLDYNGLLDLVCNRCGQAAIAGGFT